MNTPVLDATQVCPACTRLIGDHTILEWQNCMVESGFDITAPFEDTAAGGIFLPGIDGEVFPFVEIQPGVIETETGRRSVLQFVFVRASSDGDPVRLPPMNLVLTADAMHTFRTVMSKATSVALSLGKHGHLPNPKPKRRRR